MLLNCGVEKSLESPLDCKEIQAIHPKGNQSWKFIERTEVEARTLILWPPDAEEPTHLKGLWCWQRLKAGGEGDNRGWNGWMASSSQWIWVWVSSRNWWWTGRPDVLQSMGSQWVAHDWATELNWYIYIYTHIHVVSESNLTWKLSKFISEVTTLILLAQTQLCFLLSSFCVSLNLSISLYYYLWIVFFSFLFSTSMLSSTRFYNFMICLSWNVQIAYQCCLNYHI